MSNSPLSNAQAFMGFGASVNADDIFGGDNPEEPEVKVDLSGGESPDEGKETKQDTVPDGRRTIEAEDLFEDGQESVGEGDDTKDGKEAGAKESGSSPGGENLFQAFAQALKGDGLFQSLDDDAVKGISDADSFREAIDNEVNSRLDDAVREVKEALEAGVQPNVIAQYQRTIQNLNAITDEQLNAETEQGANLRRTILRQDLLLRGYKPDKVDKQVERIMQSGTDIDDAADALEAVKEYYTNQYSKTVDEAKEAAAEEKRKAKQEADEFKKAVLEQEVLFDEIPVDKATRRKAFEAMTRCVETTEEGEQLTAVQKYADENPVKFRTILGIVYAMTDGFSKMGNLFKKSVDKKVNSNLREIERRLSSQPPQGGSFNLVEGERGQRSTSKYAGLRIDIPK